MEKKLDISNIKEVLYRINVQKNIPLSVSRQAFKEILKIDNTEQRNLFMGSFLTAFMARTPSCSEIVGFLKEAFAIDGFDPKKRKKITGINGKVITIVGSGKKGVKTINISTASALLASSMGAYIVKPGSMSTSSLTGSADLIEKLGANTNIPLEKSIEILKQCNFAFFKIENLVPKFDALYNGNFYVPHTLSFGLAGLLCPVKTDVLLYGLAHPNVELSLDVLNAFGEKNVMVNCNTDDGIHFIDEMGIYGISTLIGSRNGVKGKLIKFNPIKKLNIKKFTSKDIAQKANAKENVLAVLKTLAGKGELAHENIICINTANLLYLSEKAKSLEEGFIMAKNAIKTGCGLDTLRKYVALSGGDVKILERLLEEI